MAMLARLLLERGAHYALRNGYAEATSILAGGASGSEAERRRKQAQEDSRWVQLEEGRAAQWLCQRCCMLNPLEGSLQCEACGRDWELRDDLLSADAIEEKDTSEALKISAPRGLNRTRAEDKCTGKLILLHDEAMDNMGSSTPRVGKLDITVKSAARPAPSVREVERHPRNDGQMRDLALPTGTTFMVHCGDGAWHRARVMASSSTSATISYDDSYPDGPTDTLFLPEDLELIRNILLPTGQFIREVPRASSRQDEDLKDTGSDTNTSSNTSTRCGSEGTRDDSVDGASGPVDDDGTDRENGTGTEGMDDEDEEGEDETDSEEDSDEEFSDDDEGEEESSDGEDEGHKTCREKAKASNESRKVRTAPAAGSWLEVLCEDDVWRLVRVTASVGSRALVVFEDGQGEDLFFPEDMEVVRAALAPARNSAKGKRFAAVPREDEASSDREEAKRPTLSGESSSVQGTGSDDTASGSEQD